MITGKRSIVYTINMSHDTSPQQKEEGEGGGGAVRKGQSTCTSMQKEQRNTVHLRPE